MTDLLDKARALEARLRADDATIRRVDAHFNRPDAGWPECGHDELTCPCFDGNGQRRRDLANAMLRTRDALPAIADTLRDLRAEVERLQAKATERPHFYKQLKSERNAERLQSLLLRAERDAALARVKDLEAEVAAMQPVVEDAERWHDDPAIRESILPTEYRLENAVQTYRARKP